MSIAFDPIKLVVAILLFVGAGGLAALFAALIVSKQASKWWVRLLILTCSMLGVAALAVLMDVFHVCHH